MHAASSAKRTCKESRSTSLWTATVLIPISLHVQITRQAISPRLAINIFLNLRMLDDMSVTKTYVQQLRFTTGRSPRVTSVLDGMTANSLFQREADHIQLVDHSQRRSSPLHRSFRIESRSSTSSLR